MNQKAMQDLFSYVCDYVEFSRWETVTGCEIQEAGLEESALFIKGIFRTHARDVERVEYDIAYSVCVLFYLDGRAYVKCSSVDPVFWASPNLIWWDREDRRAKILEYLDKIL